MSPTRIHLVGNGGSTTAVTLLSDGELDTLALGEGDPGLVLANDENVGLTGGEGVVNSVLDVDNVETSVVALTVSDNTNTTHVTTTGNHDDNTSVEAGEVSDLASGNVNLHGVVDLDGRVGVADGSRIVRNQEWDPALAELNTLDLAQLVFGLLSLDTVDGETALGVVDETEVLAGLLDADDVHETSGEGRVSADLAVDLDETLHHDGLNLTTVQGVLETVTDENDEGKAVAELVRTGGGLGSIGSGHFVQEPVRRRTKALLVLGRSARHLDCFVDLNPVSCRSVRRRKTRRSRKLSSDIRSTTKTRLVEFVLVLIRIIRARVKRSTLVLI